MLERERRLCETVAGLPADVRRLLLESTGAASSRSNWTSTAAPNIRVCNGRRIVWRRAAWCPGQA
jgi:hypothetical protein